jgi:hypothetical protein
MSSVTKAVKKVVKGVKKAFKSITKSSLGRALLIGATIYLGGAAMGWWNSPWQSINGAFLSPAAAEAGVATGTAATEAGTSIAAAEGGTAAGTGAAETLGAGTVIEPASAVAQEMAASSSLLGGAPATTGVYAPAAEAAKGGLISNWWAGQPDLVKFGVATTGMQAGGQLLASAFSPDALDVAEREAELARENEQWRQNFLMPNYNVGQFQLGMNPSNQPLRDAQGNLIYPTSPVTPTPPGVQPVNPQGFIQSAMR